MADWRADRIGSALRGENPTVLRRMPSGIAVIGDPQWLPGYCLLLTDDPAVTRLSDLTRPARAEFLDSMAVLAEAVEQACAAADQEFTRVNVEILGNSEPFLHAHVWPRYAWEPAELRPRPVWFYPVERWSDPDTALGARHAPLRDALTRSLDSLIG